MRKNLLSSIIIISLLFAPALNAGGWQNYLKKWSTVLVLSVLFSKVFPGQAKELGEFIDKEPILFSILFRSAKSHHAVTQ